METPNTNSSGLSDIAQSPANSNEHLLQMLDMVYSQSDIPVEAFAPDGTAIYINSAHMKLHGIPDADFIVGKYNLLHDPVCIEICGLEAIEKSFRGEPVTFTDFPVPIQDLVDRDVIAEKPYEAATMDLTMAPVWRDGKFLCTVCTFIKKNIYYGRAEVAGAKKYIDEHWIDELDEDAIASEVHVSRAHLRALFKQNTGMTLLDYYNKVKVDHIKEKLRDKNLNVSDVFSFCGVDAQGAFGKHIFKDITGMSPSEYRESV